MKVSEECPVCHGKLEEREVEKFLKSNGDTAVLRVKADVCLKCSMRFFAPRAISRFTEVKKKLQKGQTKGFIVTGKCYKVA